MSYVTCLGNKIKFIKNNNEFTYYKDNKEIDIDKELFTCKKCGKSAYNNEPDPCLGILPGVEYACCGHGNTKFAYIKFKDGTIIRGFNTIKRKF